MAIDVGHMHNTRCAIVDLLRASPISPQPQSDRMCYIGLAQVSFTVPVDGISNEQFEVCTCRW